MTIMAHLAASFLLLLAGFGLGYAVHGYRNSSRDDFPLLRRKREDFIYRRKD